MLKKYWWVLVAFTTFSLLATGTVAWLLYWPNTKSEDSESGYILFVNEYTRMDDVIVRLKTDNILISERSFMLVADYSNSGNKLKPGRYRITANMSNHALLQMLRNGLQTPLMFTFNNINFVEDFCGVAGRVFMFDSTEMVRVVRDIDFLDSLGVRPEMLLGYLLPNTYEFFWTTSPERVVIRLLQEHERFWNGQRTEKLHARGLERDEVLILASIIQKETNHVDEMARMAGVYINRLRKGMKLQADPTVKYALGDLSIRRILYRHLEHPSPYNTYYVHGLPPGVICAPNPATIDQVLNYEEHNYLFFCARPGYNSRHAFAVTNAQHEQNSSRYHAWLRSEGIR